MAECSKDHLYNVALHMHRPEEKQAGKGESTLEVSTFEMLTLAGGPVGAGGGGGCAGCGGVAGPEPPN